MRRTFPLFSFFFLNFCICQWALLPCCIWSQDKSKTEKLQGSWSSLQHSYQLHVMEDMTTSSWKPGNILNEATFLFGTSLWLCSFNLLAHNRVWCTRRFARPNLEIMDSHTKTQVPMTWSHPTRSAEICVNSELENWVLVKTWFLVIFKVEELKKSDEILNRDLSNSKIVQNLCFTLWVLDLPMLEYFPTYKLSPRLSL